MKTKIRIFASMLVLAGITVFGTAEVQAQTPQSDNAIVVGRAEVVAQVDVTHQADLRFGMVTPGVVKVIGNNGAILLGTAGASTALAGGLTEGAGQFRVTKGLNTQVTLALTLPTVLSGPLTATMPISFTNEGAAALARLNVGATDAPWSLVGNSPSLTVSNATHAAFFAANSFDVFIGGRVSPVAGQVAGTYVGDITLTATYN